MSDEAHLPDPGLLWHHVERQADERPRATALIFEGRTLTFSDVRNRSLAAAIGLRRMGLKSGDTLSIWCKNRPAFLFAYLACSYLGIRFAPVNSRLLHKDAISYCQRVQASVLIYDQMLARRRDDETFAATSNPELRRASIEELAALRPGENASKAEADSVLAVAHSLSTETELLVASTSGTTGEPKTLVYDHRILLQQLAVIDLLKITNEDRILFQVPMYYAPGTQIWLLIMMLTGMSMVLLPEFDADRALDEIASRRCTLLHGMDTHYEYLCDAQDERPRDLSSLRTGYFAPMFTPKEDIARAMDTICGGLVTVYGMTESSGTISCCEPSDSLKVKALTAGRPVSPWTEVTVAPDGELLLRGPFLFARHLDREKGTGKDDDGWYATGDLGRIDRNGRIQLTGRKKDVVRVGGEQVMPAEIERVVRGLPDVRNVKVIGVPDDTMGEIPVVVIVPETPGELDEERVLVVCRQELARWKVPRHVVSLSALPMTSTDKVSTTKLRQQVVDRLGITSRRHVYDEQQIYDEHSDKEGC